MGLRHHTPTVLATVALASFAAGLVAWQADRERPRLQASAPTRVSASKGAPGKPTKPSISAGEAARFLNQATFGAKDAETMALTTSTYDAWLNAQFAMPRTSHYQHVLYLKSIGVDIDDFTNQWAVESFWKQAITGPAMFLWLKAPRQKPACCGSKPPPPWMATSGSSTSPM